MLPHSSFEEQLFREKHGGKFSTHLSVAKVHDELLRHYWWKGMRKDITRWTSECLVYATRSTSRAVRMPLTPIPVSDRVGVDIIQSPKTSRGNQYAAVFVDYLA